MPRSTILVIDDEPNILKTVKMSLEIEGYAVEVASSGASACRSSASATSTWCCST
jgi:DNA-binding response OmpR family regulator